MTGIFIVGDGTHSAVGMEPTSAIFDSTGLSVAMTVVGAGSNAGLGTATGYACVYKCAYNGTGGAKTVSLNLPNTGVWWANSQAYTGVASVGTINTNGASSTNPASNTIGCSPGKLLFTLIGLGAVAPSAFTGSPNAATIRASITSGTGENGYMGDQPGSNTNLTMSATAATSAWCTASCVLTPGYAVPQVMTRIPMVRSSVF